MPPSQAEISSLLTQARELTERVTRAGEAMNTEATEAVALSLFEAERGLRSAIRAVERAITQLG